MHSGGLELAKLICTRLEDNLIRHRGDWFWDYDGVISESWTGVCFRAGVDIGVGIGIRVGAGGGVRIGFGLGLRLRFGARETTTFVAGAGARVGAGADVVAGAGAGDGPRSGLGACAGIDAKPGPEDGAWCGVGTDRGLSLRLMMGLSRLGCGRGLGYMVFLYQKPRGVPMADPCETHERSIG